MAELGRCEILDALEAMGELKVEVTIGEVREPPLLMVVADDDLGERIADGLEVDRGDNRGLTQERPVGVDVRSAVWVQRVVDDEKRGGAETVARCRLRASEEVIPPELRPSRITEHVWLGGRPNGELGLDRDARVGPVTSSVGHECVKGRAVAKRAREPLESRSISMFVTAETSAPPRSR